MTCPDCRCAHRAHEGRMRFDVCPLCLHDLKETA
jgi:hypothetical protein